jgi:hypothetical protein
MKKIRDYTAVIDSGTSYSNFHFESEHKAGSKANFKDCEEAYKRTYGYKPYSVEQIFLREEY